MHLQTRFVTNVQRKVTLLVVSCLAYGNTGAETYPLLSFAVGNCESLAIAHVHLDFGKALASFPSILQHLLKSWPPARQASRQLYVHMWS